MLVAELEGTDEPERFVLVHGHLDSWHIGIGDNATGDATLLEAARVLGEHRDELTRSVRIAWWSGHSHGRYAGSTWYADTFALDLARNCVCHINCDSPGCRDADVFEDVNWMAEVEAAAREAIQDFTGQTAEGHAPVRAGDISFNNLGLSTFLMLSSTMTEELRAQKGYYAVGGCGGNIAWHTPDDLMPVADLEIMKRDLAVYLTTIVRVVNSPLHPFDYTAAVDEIRSVVEEYQKAAGSEVDLTPIVKDLAVLRDEIAAWRSASEARVRGQSAGSERRQANALLRRIARTLVPINYARGERFDHDPAVKFGPVPRLEAAASIGSAAPELRPFIRTALVRERNKIRAMLRSLRREVRAASEQRALNGTPA